MADEKTPLDDSVKESGQTTPPTNAADAEKHELPWNGGCYSRKAFRFRYICLFLLAILCVFAGFRFNIPNHHDIGWGIYLAVPAILWIWLLTAAWYKSLTIKYRLEEDKIVTEAGFFRHTMDSTLIAQLNDIKFSQTLWDRLFNGGVGTITLYTSDVTHPELKLEGLEKPHEAFDAIDYLRKEYVRKRGIKSFGTTLLDDGSGVTDGLS